MMMMIEEQLVKFRIKGNLGIAIKKIKNKIKTNKQTKKRKEEGGGVKKKK